MLILGLTTYKMRTVISTSYDLCGFSVRWYMQSRQRYIIHTRQILAGGEATMPILCITHVLRSSKQLY